jgi:hypothetical protein
MTLKNLFGWRSAIVAGITAVLGTVAYNAPDDVRSLAGGNVTVLKKYMAPDAAAGEPSLDAVLDATSPTVDQEWDEAAAVANAEAKDAVFKVLESRDLYIRALRMGVEVELRTGGSITWRANNPAKIRWGKFAETVGGRKPGKDQTVAIFATEKEGTEANRKLLFETAVYKNLSLKDAMAKYAPKEQGYTPASYLAKITKATKIAPDKTLNTFTKAEQDSLLKAVKDSEGWIVGKVTTFDSLAEWEKRGW